MGDVKTTHLCPPHLPPEHEPQPKCKKRKLKHKPRVKIVKEHEYKIRCQQCMTRKCVLCKSKFKSTKELNDHMTEDHKYKFLCKYHHFRKSYSSKILKKYLDEHLKRHSDKFLEVCPHCGKAFRWRSSLGIHIQLKHPDLPTPPK